MLRLLLIVVVFAVVTYLVTRALQERGQGGRSAHPSAGSRPGGLRSSLPKLFPNLGRSEPPRPVAPDDDEDFLRDLDRKKRQPPEDS